MLEKFLKISIPKTFEEGIRFRLNVLLDGITVTYME